MTTTYGYVPVRQSIVRWFVNVAIVRWVGDYQPSIVECELIDLHGKRWLFIVKMPIVTSESLWSDSKFPRPGHLPCVAVSSGYDESGRKTIHIDTSLPCAEEAQDGTAHFEVFADQVIEAPNGYDDLPMV